MAIAASREGILENHVQGIKDWLQLGRQIPHAGRLFARSFLNISSCGEQKNRKRKGKKATHLQRKVEGADAVADSDRKEDGADSARGGGRGDTAQNGGLICCQQVHGAMRVLSLLSRYIGQSHQDHCRRNGYELGKQGSG
jgi:hypothetical protein